MFTAAQCNEVGVDHLKHVIYIGEDDVRLQSVLPACRLAQISGECAVALQILNKRIEGTP